MQFKKIINKLNLHGHTGLGVSIEGNTVAIGSGTINVRGNNHPFAGKSVEIDTAVYEHLGGPIDVAIMMLTDGSLYVHYSPRKKPVPLGAANVVFTLAATLLPAWDAKLDSVAWSVVGFEESNGDVPAPVVEPKANEEAPETPDAVDDSDNAGSDNAADAAVDSDNATEESTEEVADVEATDTEDADDDDLGGPTDDDPDEDDVELTEDDLNEMSAKEVKAVAKELGITIGKKSKSKLIAEILAQGE